MKKLTRLAVACLSFALVAPFAAPRAQDLAGRWEGALPYSGLVELERYALELALDGDDVVGKFLILGQELPVEGKYAADGRELDLRLEDGEDVGELDLTLRDGQIVGTLTHTRLGRTKILATRPSGEPAPPPLVVDFGKERPMHLDLSGVPEATGSEIQGFLLDAMERSGAVGLSVALVFEDEVLELGGLGWEDHHEDVPATAATRYRWASIAKPVTAVAALQLAEAGKLDLDADVRGYVPEFPDLGSVFTSRQLLCHQAGIVHYRHMRMRTLKEYDHPHPWTDAIIALDMFNESPLRFEPGTQYSYTTAGYALLGAVIQKAGGGTYVEQVQARICAPLGMTTMEPDRLWGEPIPHRARGYHRDGERVVDSGEDNISWKLAGGGWISNAGDLARFGKGLMGPDMLSVESQLAMWEPQVTSRGERTNYGLGVTVRRVDDVLLISHSGGQRKTSTFLLCAPEYASAVAIMCNTSGTGWGGPALDILDLLLTLQDG